ncbi:MAG: formylmethanofuran dehydrogenase subunit A [Gammaproteobacteria bacterium]
MLTKLSGGRVFDPLNGVENKQRDLYLRDGRIIAKPKAGEHPDQEYDIRDRVVMAGAIDIHTHIGGGKVNIARIMLPEDHHHGVRKRTALTRSGTGHVAPSTSVTGYRYAEMGYTACFEPAMLPANARQTHMEMADIPIVDKGAYAVLGNDDFLLRLLSSRKPQQTINDYVAWTLKATQALAIKVVNPGGINAFKFNQRKLDLDEPNRHYGITPRTILRVLARAVHELGVPHPLHVHGCNLGVPGNMETTLKTMQAVDGLPLHLTHVQFHSYGTEGERKFSSGAAKIAEAVNANPHISIDVGQMMFGQTVTASADTMHQYAGHKHAHPKKWVLMDIECEAGCGVVPFNYRDKSFVNALQWAIGLELFLLVLDPWRVFLTTDHPNGAPFTSYPHLIRLLMDRGFRKEKLAAINNSAAAMSTLGSLGREYSLYEIAILTRAAPAKTLGLADRGHLGPGAGADVTVYKEQKDKEKMFAKPELVFKDGELVARDGKVVKETHGVTHVVRPEYDKGIERTLKRHFSDRQTVSFENCSVADWEIEEAGRGRLTIHPCRDGGS